VSLVCYSIAWYFEGGSNHKAGARSWFWSGLSASHLSGDPLGVLLRDPEENPTHGPCLREGRVHDWRSTKQSPTSGSGFDVCQWSQDVSSSLLILVPVCQERDKMVIRT